MAVVTSAVFCFDGADFLESISLLSITAEILNNSVGELLRLSSDFGELLLFFRESFRLNRKKK